MHVGILRSRELQQGAVQLSSSIIDALIRKDDWKFTIINQDSKSASFTTKNTQTFFLPAFEPPRFRVLRALLAVFNLPCPKGRYASLRALGLDVLVATPSASLVGVYTGIPFIGAIADMMYKFYPQLPEYSFSERIRRHYVYKKCAQNALLMVVDSECGREHATRFLGVSPDRVKAVPYIPPPYVFELRNKDDCWVREKLARFELPDRYFFYPAQFWGHKNHARLIEAVRLIWERSGEKINVIFAGSRRGAYDEVVRVIADLKMNDNIKILGYVTEEELVALYKRSVALVFPSLFGPTNIPITEALVLGVPVACSDIFAMPEQLSGAGILFDPFSPSDIAEKIFMLWKDVGFCDRLRQKALQRMDYFSRERFSKDWIDVVQQAMQLKKCSSKHLPGASKS